MREVLQKAQQGDQAACGELVKQHQTAVFDVAYRLLHQRQLAEDASQEAFLRAFKGMASYDPKRPFGPWIKTIVTNVCLNALQKKQNQTQIVAADLARTTDEEPADLDRFASQTNTPEQALSSRERSELVRAQIADLPPRYRAVLELRHFQELSYTEMAEVLKRPLSDVKSDLFRARKQLAKRLKEKL